MLGLSDLRALSDLVGKANAWVSEVIARRKNEEERRAAQLLTTSGILVASMRTLDNSLRAIMRELNLFAPEWPKDRRDQFIERVNAFANEEKILPVVRQYCEQLNSLLYTVHHDDRHDAEEIFDGAKGILAALGDSPVTPFADTDALRTFISSIKHASTTEDVLSALAQSDSVLAVVARNVLAKADRAFGSLKGRILERHPSLPDPGWSVALSGASTAGVP
jgi:phosphoglycolate phosphatase-like HAD superfamily hydrolase